MANACDGKSPPINLPSHHRAQVLEIGFGCDQATVGASVTLWSRFLPQVREVAAYEARK